jgi:hypothetical protein
MFSTENQNPAHHNTGKNRQPTEKGTQKKVKKLFFSSTVELGLEPYKNGVGSRVSGCFIVTVKFNCAKWLRAEI